MPRRGVSQHNLRALYELVFPQVQEITLKECVDGESLLIAHFSRKYVRVADSPRNNRLLFLSRIYLCAFPHIALSPK